MAYRDIKRINGCVSKLQNTLTNKASGSVAVTLTIVSPRVLVSRIVMLYVTGLNTGG